ncbi:sensor histidine kinase [Nocardiopsis potens]|uniref:sensor histidine kinase n=1 Tax=Nocardiopsis potens TaxID=1246458 RepID=UPI00037E82EA|nr:histidine kinase [Nocardiopsis potens]
MTMTDTDPRVPDPLGGPGEDGLREEHGLRMTARLDAGLDRIGLRTPAARDRALAALMALVSTGMLWAFVRMLAANEGVRLPSAAVAALAILVYAQALALCVRRSRPVLCLAAVALAHAGAMALLPPHVTAQTLAPFIAAYTCGTLLPPRRLLRCAAAAAAVVGAGGALAAGTLLDALLRAEGAPGVLGPWTLQGHLVAAGGQLAVALAVYAGSALVGEHVATRRRYTGLVRLRAAEAVERQRERAAGAVMAERARMARELHDIAAHHLSGMVVQAGAAERLIGRDDAAAREATAWIRSQGRETLDGLRLVVGALRDPGEPDGAGLPDSGAPVPGAAALDRLVRSERDLGADVELVREGDPCDLPPVADVTVYRVAREALSNARDHAPGAPVRILLRHGASRAVLQVDNGAAPGRGGGPEPSALRGMGLIGMAERAQLIGAGLEAGPAPGGGWRVRLDVPLDREDRPAGIRPDPDTDGDEDRDEDREGTR